MLVPNFLAYLMTLSQPHRLHSIQMENYSECWIWKKDEGSYRDIF